MPPDAPIHPDVRKLDGEQFKNSVDIIVGGFPCFPAGALVTTERGYVAIENLIPGDLVWTHEGRMRRVLNTQRKMHDQTRITLSVSHHPRNIECTDEHPFWVRDRIKTGALITYSEPHWVEAKNLIPDVHVVGTAINTNAVIPEFETEVSVNQHTSRIETISLDRPEHWWLMGYFLGNGYIQDDDKNNIYFVANNDEHETVLNHLSAVVPNVIKESGLGCTTYRAHDQLWWNILVDFGRYAHGKRVPQWVQDAPPGLLKEFLDGYTQTNNMAPDTASANMDVSLGIQVLCAKLGYIASSAKLGYKQERAGGAFIESGYAWYKLCSAEVTIADECYVYNCEVEGDNSYHVDNIAVHNCVGFSPRGKRQGFENVQSALFTDVVRLANDIKPRFLFMENVPAVLSAEGGMDAIIASMGTDYDVWWCVLGASQCGAPHVRRRWYALFVRRDQMALPRSERLALDLSKRPPKFDWSPELAPPRMILGPKQTQRIAQCGNGVCVEGARAAFVLLWSGMAKSLDGALNDKEPSLRLKCPLPGLRASASRGLSFGAAIGGWKVEEEATGAPKPHREDKELRRVYRDFFDEEPAPKGQRQYIELVPVHHPHDINALLAPLDVYVDPTVFVRPPGGPLTSELIVKPTHIPFWPTPRYGNTGCGVSLTQRSYRDLPTAVRFATDTPDELRAGSLSARFCEWMQGMQSDWTMFTKEDFAPEDLAREERKKEAKERAPRPSSDGRVQTKKAREAPVVDVTKWRRLPDAAYDTDEEAAAEAGTEAEAEVEAEEAAAGDNKGGGGGGGGTYIDTINQDDPGYLSSDW